MDEKKIPRDRNGTELSPGDFVWVFWEEKSTNFMAKVLFPGVEKSTLATVGGRTINEPVDNKNLEAV